MARRIVLPAAADWRLEVQDLVRAMSGGFLFGIPLLYTMEVWWIGSFTEPPQMLAVLAATYLIVLLLNRTDGFRQLHPDSLKQSAIDSIEAMAIALLCALGTLLLLQQVTLETPLSEALGKVVLETTPFALGVALARSILQEDEDNGDGEDDSSAAPEGKPSKDEPAAASDKTAPAQKLLESDTLRDLGATLVGALIIAFNIAPTDEISMLEAAIAPSGLLAVIAASLAISYCIVFAAGFASQKRRQQQSGLFQHPLSETVISYLVSLLLAAAMLWFFHRLGLSDPWQLWFKYTLILGLPATIGGAAGRLAI